MNLFILIVEFLLGCVVWFSLVYSTAVLASHGWHRGKFVHFLRVMNISRRFEYHEREEEIPIQRPGP